MKKNAMSLTNIYCNYFCSYSNCIVFCGIMTINTDQTLTSMAPNEFNVVATQDAKQFEQTKPTTNYIF